MRLVGLALVGVLAVTEPFAAQANGPESNTAPAPGIVVARDGSCPPWRSAIGSRPMAGRHRQWNGVSVPPRWGPNPYNWQGAPTYWVWGPRGGAFDYPFADWRGPTGGWGNP
jgi:hypothetical protein